MAGGGGMDSSSALPTTGACVFAGIVIVGLRGRVFLSPSVLSSEVLGGDSEVDGFVSATCTTTWDVGLGGLTISNAGSFGPCLERLILRAGKCFFAVVATCMPNPVGSATIVDELGYLISLHESTATEAQMQCSNEAMRSAHRDQRKK